MTVALQGRLRQPKAPSAISLAPRRSSERRLPVNDGETTAEGWCYYGLPSAVRARFSRERLVSDCQVADAGYFPRSAGHKAKRREALQEAILLVCVAGQGWVADLGRKRSPRLAVRANEVVLIPPGVPHFYAADSRNPWSILWFHFSGPRAGLFLEQLGLRRTMAKGLLRNTVQFAEPIRHMLELRRRGLSRAVLIECNALAELVLARLHAENCLEPLAGTGSTHLRRPSPEQADKLRGVTAFLEANYRSNIQIADLAKMVHVSESWLFHAFAAHSGFTPLGFLTHLRLQEACRLLVETTRKLTDIAAAVGYDDPFYFSRLFKKHIGRCPDSYRHEHRR